MTNPSPTPPPPDRSERTSYAIGVVAICLGSIAVPCMLINDPCCLGFSFPFSCLATLLSLVALAFARTKVAVIALVIGLLGAGAFTAKYLAHQQALDREHEEIFGHHRR